MLKNTTKQMKIMKTEKTIQQLTDGILVKCTNPECRTKIKLKEDEIGRNFACTTCNKGRLTQRVELTSAKKKKKNGPVIRYKKSI